MRSGRLVGLAVAAACLIGSSPADAQRGDALQHLRLAYEGSFRVPDGPTNETSFEYGGTALTYDPVRRSLWLVGHDHHQLVAEISVPDIGGASSVEGLATAQLLTPFHDILRGRLEQVGDSAAKIGGLLRDGSDWIVSAWVYYDASNSQTGSHFRVSADGDVSGPFQLGAEPGRAGFVAGYMSEIASEWQGRLRGPALTGQCCVNIISRSSLGPAATVFDPADIGVRSPAPVTHVLNYPINRPTLGEWASGGDRLFNGNTQMGGVVFPRNTSTVIFFGRVGLGDFCYGSGTPDPALHGRSEGGLQLCYDPAESSQGSHGYPYALHFWAYDANELADVSAGRRQPWEIVPYESAVFTLPFEQGQKRVGGVGYDPSTNRVFLSVLHQDGPRPLIHVLRVTPPSGGSRSRRPDSPPVGRAAPR